MKKYINQRGHGRSNTGYTAPNFGFEPDLLARQIIIAGALETIATAADLAAVKSAAAKATRELAAERIEEDAWFWSVAKNYWAWGSGHAAKEIRAIMTRCERHLPDITDAQFRAVVTAVAWPYFFCRSAVLVDGEANIGAKGVYDRALAGTLKTQAGGLGIYKHQLADPPPTCRIRWGPPDPKHADHFDTDRASDTDDGFIPWSKLPTAKITSTTPDAPFIINANNPTPDSKSVFFYCFRGGEAFDVRPMPQRTDVRIDIEAGCSVQFRVVDKTTTAPAAPAAIPDTTPTQINTNPPPANPPPPAPEDTSSDDDDDD